MLLLVYDDGRCCNDRVSTSFGEDDNNRMKGSNDVQQMMETSELWRCVDLVLFLTQPCLLLSVSSSLFSLLFFVGPG